MQPITIGIIGCGVISDVYLKGARRSDYINVKSVADMHSEAAAAKAAEHGVIAATSPAVLLADPDISIVINLTVPLAHAAVNRAIVAAGKHVMPRSPSVHPSPRRRNCSHLRPPAGSARSVSRRNARITGPMRATLRSASGGFPVPTDQPPNA